MVAVECAAELVDGRRHLEAVHEDALLSLDADILGPLDEARQVALRLDRATDAVVAWVLLEKRVLFTASFAFSGGAGSNDTLYLGELLNLWRRSNNAQPSSYHAVSYLINACFS